jgi:hypothetical protein
MSTGRKSFGPKAKKAKDFKHFKKKTYNQKKHPKKQIIPHHHLEISKIIPEEIIEVRDKPTKVKK